MKGQHLFLTSNGYDLLESYTTRLYGDRGSFRHNLERYLKSDEFRSSCKLPENIADIPELTFGDIRDCIDREKYYFELSQQVADRYDDLVVHNQLTDEAAYEYAGILGLCPGQCDWYQTLFPHVVDLFVSSEEEGKRIWQSVADKPNIVSVMVSAMTDGIRNCQIINMDGRELCSKGYARNYFRGENAYNKSSRPSLFRNMPMDCTDKRIHMVLGWIRIIEFSLWLNELSFVQGWHLGNVFHAAIAQHYGIPTNGMDVTSDLKTALFFACCHYENGKWRPLRADEFASADSREDVADRGGDSRYGILFSEPADIANMSRVANLPELRLTYAMPIGYQPFMRCASQNGFAINAAENYDMFRDSSFKKVKFRLTEEICNWIYTEMDEGALIYPNESFGTCDDVVEAIKSSKVYTERAFQYTLEYLKLTAEKDNIEAILQSKGYRIEPDVSWCTPERKRELELNWLQNADTYRQLSEPPSFRFGFCI